MTLDSPPPPALWRCLWLNLLPPPSIPAHHVGILLRSPRPSIQRVMWKRPQASSAGSALPAPVFSPGNAIHLYPAAQSLSSSLSWSVLFLSHSHPLLWLPPLSTSFPSNYSSSHPESRGQRWMSLGLRLMSGNGEGRMNPGQMGINKETGLKDGSCYGQRGCGGWGAKKCHCCHIRSDHMFDTPVCLLYGWSAVSSVTRGYTSVRFTGSRGLSTLPCWKITPLIDQVVGWRRTATPAHGRWVLTWPCLRVSRWAWNRLTRVNEGNGVISYSFWTASSLGLRDTRGGGHRFMMPDYANSINRFKPSQVEIQGKEHIKREKKTEKEEKKTAWALHHAVVLQTRS